MKDVVYQGNAKVQVVKSFGVLCMGNKVHEK